MKCTRTFWSPCIIKVTFNRKRIYILLIIIHTTGVPHLKKNISAYCWWERKISWSLSFFLPLFCFFLSSCTSYSDLFPPTDCRCRELVYLITLSDTHTHTHTHFVGLLWKRDRSVAETCTWQLTTLTRERHQWPRRESNHRSHSWTALLIHLANVEIFKDKPGGTCNQKNLTG
jgi:hypothetical protein